MPKEKNQHKSTAASDEKFRDFFTTTVADIPAEMVRREEEAAEEQQTFEADDDGRLPSRPRGAQQTGVREQGAEPTADPRPEPSASAGGEGERALHAADDAAEHAGAFRRLHHVGGDAAHEYSARTGAHA